MAIDGVNEQIYKSILSDLTDELKKRKELEAEINDALEKGDMRAYYKALEKNTDELIRIGKDATKASIQFNSLASKTQQTAQTLVNFRNATPAGKMLYLGQALSNTGKSLTDLRDKIYALQKDIGTTFSTAVDSGAAAFTNQITSLFTAGPALSFRDSVDAINAFQKEFGTLLTRGAASQIAKGAKQFGTDINTFVKAQRTFLGAGGLANQAKLQQQFVTQFRAAGLTANQALVFAANNANLVAIAGVKYADSLARAAANATKIGVSLEKTSGFYDTIVDDFEGGLERASELRAMGFEYDFNEIARIAGTGTEEERQAGIVNLFQRNRALLEDVQRNAFLRRSIEKDTGFSIAEAMKMAKGSEALPGQETKPEETENGPLAGFAKVIGPVLTAIGGLVSVMGILGGSLVANTIATNANTIASGGTPGGMLSSAKNILTKGGVLGRVGLGSAGLAVGIGGAMAGRALVDKGYKKTGIGVGALGGGLGAAMLALALAPATGGASLALYAGLGALAAGTYAGMGSKRAGDIAMGPGKGRVILGPEGIFSLSPRDQLLAGTKLFGDTADKGMKLREAQAAFSLLIQNYGRRFFLGKNPLIANPFLNAGIDVGTSLLQGKGLRQSLMMGGGTLAGGLIGKIGGAAVGRMVGGAMGSVLGPVGAIAGGALGSYLVGKMLQSKETPVQSVSTPTQIESQASTTNMDMSKLESKLDKLASAFANIKIQMDGNTVGRVSLNARSPLDRLSVVG